MTTASRKLLAALPRSGRDEATRISERFHLDPVDWYRATEPVPHLPAIARAVLDQRCIAMKYENWRSTRRWRIEPLGVVLKAGSWYVVARVSGKSGVDSFRNFKIANVIEFAVDEASFERPADFDLAGHWAQSLARFEAGLRPTKATLRASELGLFRLSELGRYAADAVREADPSDADGWARVRLPIETIERAALSLLSIGAEVEVLEPALLRDQVRTVAAQITHRADKRSFEQANGVHKKEKLDG